MKQRLIDVFQRTFGLESVSDDLSQKNCTKWDSLNHLNLVIELEEEFAISLEPEEIAEMKEFSIVERIVAAKLG